MNFFQIYNSNVIINTLYHIFTYTIHVYNLGKNKILFYSFEDTNEKYTLYTYWNARLYYLYNIIYVVYLIYNILLASFWLLCEHYYQWKCQYWQRSKHCHMIDRSFFYVIIKYKQCIQINFLSIHIFFHKTIYFPL